MPLALKRVEASGWVAQQLRKWWAACWVCWVAFEEAVAMLLRVRDMAGAVTTSGNAMLRLLNPLVDERLGSHRACFVCLAQLRNDQPCGRNKKVCVCM